MKEELNSGAGEGIIKRQDCFSVWQILILDHLLCYDKSHWGVWRPHKLGWDWKPFLLHLFFLPPCFTSALKEIWLCVNWFCYCIPHLSQKRYSTEMPDSNKCVLSYLGSFKDKLFLFYAIQKIQLIENLKISLFAVFTFYTYIYQLNKIQTS